MKEAENERRAKKMVRGRRKITIFVTRETPRLLLRPLVPFDVFIQ